MTTAEKFLSYVDVEYSYQLAKKMETFKSHPVLGYRCAGSEAERQTGEMLYQEMKSLGFSDVKKDKILVDSWEFKKSRLEYTDKKGTTHTFHLGGYQTQIVTKGAEKCSLVYLKKGMARDYQGKDVKGKLVLVEINQRDEWWINYPVYQAYLKGAKALIAVQAGGYGEIDEEALNAQDIAGPKEAPAFSISRKDAKVLLEALKEEKEITVTLDADSRVARKQPAYNICGTIPGRHPQRMILLSAHYDSYFDGFEDDNTAISMMLSIGRSLLQMGYRPENTLVFCAMAAEEWGVVDSIFDWSTGAYQQVFHVHPEWAGKVIADLNFELPAIAHDTCDRIRSVYEYQDFLKEFVEKTVFTSPSYPEGVQVTGPIETMSDDFSMAIAGIPSMVNDFTSGSFMETHYHSQFDNDGYYDEEAYRFHHNLYGTLLLALDGTAAVPLNFAAVFENMKETVEEKACREAGLSFSELQKLLTQARDQAEALYCQVKEENQKYQAVLQRDKKEADKLYQAFRETEKSLLTLFKTEQDEMVRLDWHGEVWFPHEILQNSLKALDKAVEALQEQDLSGALNALYQIDNNRYAFMFEKEVYLHFTDYVIAQDEERLQWGKNRILCHENLYELVQELLKKWKKKGSSEEDTDNYQAETDCLKELKKQQLAFYKEEWDRMSQTIKDMKETMHALTAKTAGFGR